MCDFLNTTFCRLCLNITEAQQSEVLAGDKELCTILGNVFPGMKLDLIPAPKICFTCRDKLQFAYNFKNTVLCNEQKIESNKDCFINGIDACRLCLKENLGKDIVYLWENNHYSYSYQLIRTVTEIATAPLNFDNLEKPIMCTKCWSSVRNTYGFKKRCFDNEKKLRNLYKKMNNDLNSLSTEEILTTIILKEKALIHTSDKTLYNYSESQSVVSLDSDNKDIVSEDIKNFLTYPINKDAVLISGSDSDDNLPDSKFKNEHSDSECSEDIFDEEIDGDVVEIRIKSYKNVDETKLNDIDSKNRNIITDVAQPKNHGFLGEVEKELVKEEMSFEEHNIDYKGFSFGDTSSIRKTSLDAVSEHHNVKVETTSNKITKLKKSLTIHLVDCVKYQSNLNIEKITTKNEKNNRPHPELSTNNPPKRTIKCGECNFVTSSKDTMTRHMEKHILYSDTGNKCLNCQKVYQNPDILEEHIQSCEVSVRKKLSSKKLSKTTQKIFKHHISQHTKKGKCGNIRLGDNIKTNKSTECDQNAAETIKPANNLKETSLETLKKLAYQCSNCNYKTTFHSKYVLHLEKVHKRRFICDICQKGYKNKSDLNRHRLTHSEEKKFICDVCQKGFITKSEVNKHQVTHRTERNYICDICHKAFKSYYLLNNHQITHRTDRNYICDICEKGFKTNNYLRVHRRIHCEDKKFTCHFDLCQKGFKTKGELRRHLVTHRTERTYICDICHKAFKTNTILKMHKITHRTDRTYICDICEEAFKTDHALRYHRLSHSEERKFICDVCQKAFRTKSDIIRHQMTHRKDNNYICDICHKAFKTCYALNTHQITHRTDRNYVCDICEKSFKSNQTLKEHRSTHCEDKKFTCAICQMKFKIKVNLKKHLMTHRTDGNYICNICEKSFKAYHTLRYHRLSHSEERKFVCDVCQKWFKTKGAIIRHQETHTTDKNYICDICHKAFKSCHHLNAHQITHRTDRNYVCDICEKSFKRNHALKEHRLTHCEDKKFTCDLCQKRFKIEVHLKKHQMRHRTDRNYICHICQKGFKHKTMLTGHIQAHRNENGSKC